MEWSRWEASGIDGQAGTLREHHGSSERVEMDTERARQLISAERDRAGWEQARLATERKGHPLKVALARRLRQETTMSLKRIAAELHMGTWTHLNRLLHTKR